jgi:hypothetical protein
LSEFIQTHSAFGRQAENRIANALEIRKTFLNVRISKIRIGHIGICEIVLVADYDRRNARYFCLRQGAIDKAGPEWRGSNTGNADNKVNVRRKELRRLSLLIKPDETVPPFFKTGNQAVIDLYNISRRNGVVIAFNPFEHLAFNAALNFFPA